MAKKQKSCSEKDEEIKQKQEVEEEAKQVNGSCSSTKNRKGEDKKRVGCWSADDEIALLKGMVDYHMEKGVDPYEDMTGFFEFVKGFIGFDVMRRQVTDKLCRFKTKFLRNEFVLSKGHDCKLFDISKKIKSWGGGGDDDKNNDGSEGRKDRKRGKGKVVIDDSVTKVNKDVKMEDVKEDDMVEESSGDEMKSFYDVYPRLSHALEEEIANHMLFYKGKGVKDYVEGRIRLIGRDKAKELENKWSDLELEECELFAKKIKLMNTQTKLLLDGIESCLS